MARVVKWRSGSKVLKRSPRQDIPKFVNEPQEPGAFHYSHLSSTWQLHVHLSVILTTFVTAS